MLAVAQDQFLVFDAGITNAQPQHEPIQLRLRQRIGAVMFDWVLRRYHEERLRQLMRHALNSYMAFSHRFEQGRLRLRRSAIDLVGQHDVGKDRTWPPFKQSGRLVVNR